MNVLELFAGSCSFSKAAQQQEHKTLTTDIEQFGDIDLVTDILELDYKDIPFTPDIIWASPPCTGFSVAAIGHHWTGGKGAYIPKTDKARLGIELVKKTTEIIKHYQEINPDLIWYIENPRGLLRKLGLIDGIRNTVTYCQYGDNRMKPTDIWTNDDTWKPRDMCKNGMPCHESAPRGSKTGTQGLKNNYERSKIPSELCLEIIKNI